MITLAALQVSIVVAWSPVPVDSAHAALSHYAVEVQQDSIVLAQDTTSQTSDTLQIARPVPGDSAFVRGCVTAVYQDSQSSPQVCSSPQLVVYGDSLLHVSPDSVWADTVTPPPLGAAIQLEAFLDAQNLFDFTKWDSARVLWGQSDLRWARVVLDWRWIEEVQGQAKVWDGPYYPYDRVFADLRADGIQTLGLLSNSPSWAGSPPNPTLYASFAQEAAARYAGIVDHWEVWNEPNIPQFWPSGPDVDVYMDFLATVAQGIRAGNPDAFIVSGGLAHAPTILDWLDSMQVLGLDTLVDAVGVHAYTWYANPPDQGTGIGSFRMIDEAATRVTRPLWLTEQGWQAGEVGDSLQAVYLAQSLSMIQSRPFVGGYWYFEGIDKVGTYGLLTDALGVRPSLAALTWPAEQEDEPIMATLFDDNFDDGDISGWTTVGTPAGAASSEEAATGTYSAKFTGANTTMYQTITAKDEIWTRFYIYMDSIGGQSEVHLLGNGGVNKVFPYIATNGDVDVFKLGGGAAGYTGTESVNTGEWNLIEFHYVVDSSAGVVELWVNGVQSINSTGQNTGSSGSDSITRVSVGLLTNSNTYYYDNVGASDSAFLGTAAVASASTASVDATVTAGDTVNITVTAKDANSSAMNIGGETVAVSVTGANTATPTVTDVGDGTYTAEYPATNTGTDSVAITLNGVAISGSPYEVEVLPASPSAAVLHSAQGVGLGLNLGLGI